MRPTIDVVVIRASDVTEDDIVRPQGRTHWTVVERVTRYGPTEGNTVVIEPALDGGGLTWGHNDLFEAQVETIEPWPVGIPPADPDLFDPENGRRA